jgi:hypothetical protein
LYDRIHQNRRAGEGFACNVRERSSVAPRDISDRQLCENRYLADYSQTCQDDVIVLVADCKKRRKSNQKEKNQNFGNLLPTTKMAWPRRSRRKNSESESMISPTQAPTTQLYRALL